MAVHWITKRHVPGGSPHNTKRFVIVVVVGLTTTTKDNYCTPIPGSHTH